jgi:hypothetical protein
VFVCAVSSVHNGIMRYRIVGHYDVRGIDFNSIKYMCFVEIQRNQSLGSMRSTLLSRKSYPP